MVTMAMLDKTRSRADLLLLLSLLLVIVMCPVLDHGVVRRLVLAGLMFVVVLLATVRLSETKGWVWPSVLLMAVTFIFAVVSTVFPIPILVGIKWALLTVFFGLTVAGLFSYLKNARSVIDAPLPRPAFTFCLGCSGSPSIPPSMFSIRALSCTALRGQTGKANCCTSAWLLSRRLVTAMLSRLAARCGCWQHWKGSRASSTSRSRWRCWSVPTSSRARRASLHPRERMRPLFVGSPEINAYASTIPAVVCGD